jgi:hypothetical protein
VSHRVRAIVAGAALGFLAPTVLVAQAPAPSPAPTAKPEDVSSPDAILGALYDVISGPAGKGRDWNRFRSLFIPGARLIPTRVREDGATATVITPDEYATTIGPRLEQGGFFEKEIHRTVEQFGNVMHAFSTYESRRKAEDPQPFARGINSIQLLKDGNRWWVVTIYWDSERPNNTIPAKYLPK